MQVNTCRGSTPVVGSNPNLTARYLRVCPTTREFPI